MFKLNHLCDPLRQDLSSPGRSTWATTKTRVVPCTHLMIYTAWKNGYAVNLDVFGTFR